MKRIAVAFVIGMLVGGTLAYLFLPAQVVVSVLSSSGAVPGESDGPASASSTVHDAAGTTTNAVDDPESTGSAGRDALVALGEALAIERRTDRQNAIRGAVELLEALPSVERAKSATLFAARFANADSDAALEWARDSRMPNVFDEVLATLAVCDPYRALDLAVEEGGPGSLTRVATVAIHSPTTMPSEFADAVFASPETPARSRSLTMMTQSWTERDPEAALKWLLGLPSNATSGLLTTAAGTLKADPVLATRYVDRVPPQVRSQWITITARNFAAMDPDDALEWIESLRNYPEYNQALAGATLVIAEFDAASAAEIIESRALWGNVNLAADVVWLWSEYDPDAASRWAASIPYAPARQTALTNLGNTWAQRYPDNAAQFVAGLPAGQERDRVLERMLRSAANGDNWTLIDNLIPSFSSNEARERAVAEFSTRIARGYEAEARRLMERFVTDAALWNQFEARLTP